MNKMRIRWVILSWTILLLSAGIFYAYKLTFPKEIEAKIYFNQKEQYLDKFVDEFLEHETYRRISVFKDTMQIEIYNQLEIEVLSGEVARPFIKLVNENNLFNMAVKIERGVLLHMISIEQSGRHIKVALIKDSGNSREPSCEISALEVDFGKCEMVLNESWVLHYEWVTPEG